MRWSIIYLIALVCIAGAAKAQSWTYGPGDTVKLPLELMDSIANPAAVDSAADSVLVRVIKNQAANAGGADTCYLHRGLLDASTNSSLHTTNAGATTLGFGSVPKRVQTFTFLATAYTLTNSATASGTYTIEYWTYDHSLGLITKRERTFNYVYVGTSTMTYKDWADSLIIATRNSKAMTDSINAILDSLQLYDNWLRDSVHNQSVAVLALAASAANLTKVIDTVNAILDTLQLYDGWLRDSVHNQSVAVLALAASAANLTKVIDTVNGILDTLQLYDNWLRDSIHNQGVVVNTEVTKVKDTVNATLDTLQLYDNWLRDSVHNQSVVVNTQVTKVIDTVNGVIDTLQNASSTLRVATVDTAAVARAVWDNDVVALVNRTATATATVDTAAIARSVWDNDVVARANRTVDQVDTVVLACINGDTVSSAGDFLKTALDYREAIKNIYGVATSNSTWMTDTVLNQLIRQAVVKVNPIMRGVKFKDTVITAWQQSDYNLDSMIGVISVSWQREDTVRPIVYAPLETWGALNHQSTWGGDDPYLSRPSVYDVTDNQIMFFPPPTQVDTIEIVGFRKVYGIVTTSDFSAIPQSYRIPVLYYAAFLVAQSKQHPGTERMLNEYNKAVSDVLVALNRRANVQTDSK